MLSVKKLLTKILQWLDNPEIVYSSGETFYKATRTDTNVGVGVGVGGGGSNHGLYSYKSGGWIIHQNSAGVTYIKGTAFNDLFVLTEHVLTTSLTITSGNPSSNTYNISKNGYIPVAIAGYRVSNGSGSGGSFALPYGLTLTASAVGSGTVQTMFRAVGAVNNCTLRVTVLWIKNI